MSDTNIETIEPVFEATVYANSGLIRMRIEVFGSDIRFLNLPYFKLTKGKNWLTSKAEDRVRIAFQKIAYVRHDSDKGLWTLTSKEKLALMKVLTMEHNKFDTVWNAMLYEAIKSSNNKLSMDFMKLPLLDYTKLDPNISFDNAPIIPYIK